MPAISATAPGKIILLGEHAVVYGFPAIAVPVAQVRARAVVMATPRAASGTIRIQAPEIRLDACLEDLPPEYPLACAVRGVLSELGIVQPPAFHVRITSTIPIAAGLGSGAAVSVATIRAVAAFLGHPLPAERISALAYEVEKLYHGTPSGIDNSVVTYAQPLYFVRGQEMQFLNLSTSFTIVIGDTGIYCPTASTVMDVRQAWQADPEGYEALFNAIGRIAEAGRQAIEVGDAKALGQLMDENHELLRKLGVSSPELDRLVEAAHAAGAWGAKLSGGGRGGNMIALVDPDSAHFIADALKRDGAVRTIITAVRPSGT